MNNINWQVSNMHCGSCVATIKKSLEQDAQKDISVNLLNGAISFKHNQQISLEEIKIHIENLGYKVQTSDLLKKDSYQHSHHADKKTKWYDIKHNYLAKFLFSLIFTTPLLLHMFVNATLLHNAFIQLILALPVYILGIITFGKSAIKSIKNQSPNMNVLILLGASSAFIYSLVGVFILNDNNYLLFETSSSILMLIFLGHYLEERTSINTQKSIKKLLQSKPLKATLVTANYKNEEIFTEILASELQIGQTFILKTGDKVPADAKIYFGQAKVNEAIITGESLPVEKNNNDTIIGGSVVEQGNLKAKVLQVGDESVLGQIVKYVKEAEKEKPDMQILADKISGIFVPIVLFIAGFTFVFNFYMIEHNLEIAIMRSIAVLVISCPCALGLATPAAIAVGLGRASQLGVLYKNAKSLGLFYKIKQIAFDKTGTLTTGHFSITELNPIDIDKNEFEKILFSMEKYSTHPIAKSVVKNLSVTQDIKWKHIEEIKGLGIKAIDENGNTYILGSKKIVEQIANAPLNKSVYILKNDGLIGWVDLKDEIRKEAIEVIQYFKRQAIKVILISGDNQDKTAFVAKQLGIEDFYYEQSPEMKLQLIDTLNKTALTAMVGDGINDAPALAKSSVGISINGAAHISIEASLIILMHNSLIQLPLALNLGKATHNTIKQNLFWAFAYNIIAIPLATFGFMSPILSSFLMGVSDMVLGLNSARLYFKKIK